MKEWYDRPKFYGRLCKECGLRPKWSSDIAVSHNLAKQSNIQSENTGCETLLFSPLTRTSIYLADSSLLHLLFLGSLSILSVIFLTYLVATKIRSCHELDPWHNVRIPNFNPPNFLPIYLMIMAALAIIQALIWVGVGIGKFLIDLSVRNIFTQLLGLGTC